MFNREKMNAFYEKHQESIFVAIIFILWTSIVSLFTHKADKSAQAGWEEAAYQNGYKKGVIHTIKHYEEKQK